VFCGPIRQSLSIRPLVSTALRLSVFGDYAPVTMRISSRLTGRKFTHLSASRTTSWTTNGQRLFFLGFHRYIVGRLDGESWSDVNSSRKSHRSSSASTASTELGLPGCNRRNEAASSYSFPRNILRPFQLLPRTIPVTGNGPQAEDRLLRLLVLPIESGIGGRR
jgi:hypothetical protein